MPHKRKPGAVAATGPSKSFCLAVEHFEDIPSFHALQAKTLASRFGLTPPVARVVASLHFGKART